MQISVQDFVKKYDGKAVDFDKQYGAQCVDLFNYYNTEVVGAPFIGTPATGGARDLYEVDSPTRAEFYKKLGTNSRLQVGDVEVYGEPHGRYIDAGVTKFFGHVRIFVGQDTFIEQNGKISQKTTLTTQKLSGRLGILRPLKFIGQNIPQDAPPVQQNKNKHIIAPGDTFWGLEERYNIEHGKLQQFNPEFDAHALPIGGELRLYSNAPQANSPTEEYYTIAKGDTLWGLENAWQLSHGTLQQLNPGIEPRKLQIGQRIRKR